MCVCLEEINLTNLSIGLMDIGKMVIRLIEMISSTEAGLIQTTVYCIEFYR